MSKLIFVLTYREGDLFIKNYRPEFFPSDAQIIILDNGSQDNIRAWAEEHGAWYHATENNLGTTGGYNWFIRVGNLLKANRAVIMQADVEVLRPETFNLLFDPKWQPWDFAYFPNLPRDLWDPNGCESDIGQLFSIDPKFWLESGWLCDENYTITHYESIDLFNRIASERQMQPATIHNLLYENSSNSIEDQSYFRHHSVSNAAGEHNPWFTKNYDYWKKKWAYHHAKDKSPEQGWEDFIQQSMVWADGPWITRRDYWSSALLNHWTLDPWRNIAVGQVPYPVEHEVNRFYLMMREKLSP